MALSPPDERLLSALFAPCATRDAVAAAHDLSPTALALWLEQPHIQRAYQAMLALDAHFARLWQEQHYRTSIETLAEVQKTSDNLVERRRTATRRALAQNPAFGRIQRLIPGSLHLDVFRPGTNSPRAPAAQSPRLNPA